MSWSYPDASFLPTTALPAAARRADADSWSFESGVDKQANMLPQSRPAVRSSVQTLPTDVSAQTGGSYQHKRPYLEGTSEFPNLRGEFKGLRGLQQAVVSGSDIQVVGGRLDNDTVYALHVVT